MLQLTAELVDIPSVSHDEDKAAAFVAGALGDADHLATTESATTSFLEPRSVAPVVSS